jgi:hypothetical protein
MISVTGIYTRSSAYYRETTARAPYIGEFPIRSIPDMLVLGAGGLLMAVMLAQGFGATVRQPTG